MAKNLDVALINSAPEGSGVGRYANELQGKSSNNIVQFYIDKKDNKLIKINQSGERTVIHSLSQLSNRVIRKTGTVGTAMAIYGLGKEVPEGFDVYHLADQNMVNLAFSPKIDPVITTVHDLVYLKLAGNIVEEMVSKALFYGTKKSDQIISISESTSQDIQNHLSIPSLKVNTVYNGVSREFSPATEERVTRFC